MKRIYTLSLCMAHSIYLQNWSEGRQRKAMHLTQMFARFEGDGLSDISTFGCLSSLINAQLGPGRGLLRNKQIEELIDFEDKQPLLTDLFGCICVCTWHKAGAGNRVGEGQIHFQVKQAGFTSEINDPETSYCFLYPEECGTKAP